MTLLSDWSHKAFLTVRLAQWKLKWCVASHLTIQRLLSHHDLALKPYGSPRPTGDLDWGERGHISLQRCTWWILSQFRPNNPKKRVCLRILVFKVTSMLHNWFTYTHTHIHTHIYIYIRMKNTRSSGDDFIYRIICRLKTFRFLNLLQCVWVFSFNSITLTPWRRSENPHRITSANDSMNKINLWRTWVVFISVHFHDNGFFS